MKVQGICRICNKNKCVNKGRQWGYRSTCKTCYVKHRLPSGGVCGVKKKKSICEKCGFVPVHSAQLDIHHIDHNHFNNDLSNLKTLCANCHRLEHI